MSRWKNTILSLLFRRIIKLTLTVRTICTSIQSVCVYVRSSVRTRIRLFVRLPFLSCCVFGTCSSVRVSLSPDRGLPLFPNIVLHVWPQISTEHPPPFIVGLIWSPQYCFITLIQYCTLNLSISHSSFGTHLPGTLVVVNFVTSVGPLDTSLDLQFSP